jgi:hypothetical protein
MNSVKDSTKTLLAARRALEISLLREIQDWEKQAGLCVTRVTLHSYPRSFLDSTLDRTEDVKVEVLL